MERPEEGAPVPTCQEGCRHPCPSGSCPLQAPSVPVAGPPAPQPGGVQEGTLSLTTPGSERLLERKAFLRHFRNSLQTAGHSLAMLCGLVERLRRGVETDTYTGTFKTQPNEHAELHFLHWLDEILQPRDEDDDDDDTHFLVTCFVSQSPCLSCAEEMGTFLEAHGNVQLRLLTARLYCPWNLIHCEGLSQLHQQGVLVDIMAWPDFQCCWDLFVRSEGAALQPWWGLGTNHEQLLDKLQDILGPRMEMDTFMGNFDNKMNLSATVLCYEVQGAAGHTREPPRTGLLQNWGRNSGQPVHAELLFLDRVRAWALGPCSIACYISWSPCFRCARELARFLRQHRHVQLSIRAARLYTCESFETGLCELRDAGAHVSIMTRADFEHCWDTFVQSKGQPFTPPSYLDEVSEQYTKELEAIFQDDHVEDHIPVPQKHRDL